MNVAGHPSKIGCEPFNELQMLNYHLALGFNAARAGPYIFPVEKNGSVKPGASMQGYLPTMFL